MLSCLPTISGLHSACGPPGQADDVLRQLVKLLTAGGSSIERVLQVTIYLTNLAEKPDFNRVWKAHFNEINLPARAVIGVADLGPGDEARTRRDGGGGWVGPMLRKRLTRPLTTNAYGC